MIILAVVNLVAKSCNLWIRETCSHLPIFHIVTFSMITGYTRIYVNCSLNIILSVHLYVHQNFKLPLRHNSLHIL